jgi:5-formyltetrahydrofolate cyclo-ligase
VRLEAQTSQLRRVVAAQQNDREFIREQAHANRNAQANKDELSQEICARFVGLDAYGKAKTVMYYIDVRSEVRTRHDLPNALTQGKKIVVPWCNQTGELELFHLESMDELAIGMYKILEPRPELRPLPAKRAQRVVARSPWTSSCGRRSSAGACFGLR